MPTITRSVAIQNGYPTNRWFVQTILIDKHAYTRTQAKQWLQTHAYYHSNKRTTTNYWRYMQTNPVQGAIYFTDVVYPGIEIVYQRFK
jgi:hypothetical protein